MRGGTERGKKTHVDQCYTCAVFITCIKIDVDVILPGIIIDSTITGQTLTRFFEKLSALCPEKVFTASFEIVRQPCTTIIQKPVFMTW